MLAAIRDFLYTWQFIHLFVIAGGWLGLGSWLLLRSLRKRDQSKRVRLGRCVGIALTAGVCAGPVGLVFFFLVQAVAGAFEADTQTAGILGAVVGGIAVILTVFMVIYGMLGVSMKETLRIASLPVVVLFAFGAILGGDAALRARAQHRRDVRQALCGENLKYILEALKASQRNTGEPANDLQSLTKDNLISADRLTCPGPEDPARAIGYFYLPGRIAADQPEVQRIIVCDLSTNHAAGRNVMLADGRIMWDTDKEFKLLLEQDQNKEFAAALHKAEGQ